MKIIKATIITLMFLGVLFMPGLILQADVITPTITNVYFEKNDRHYDQTVNFTVNCYGYTFSGGFLDPQKKPGTYTPERVFSFSATCPEYGCEIYESYYLNYRHIDYCDLEGELDNGEEFTIKNYGSSPVDFSKCVEDNSLLSRRRCELRFTIPNTAPICTDSDKGKNYYQRGYLSGVCPTDSFCGVYMDVCKDGNKLIEYFCDGNSPKTEEYTCPNGCELEACLPDLDGKLAKRLEGAFLLAVENDGQTYYVKNLKKYKVTSGNLLKLFERLAHGITDRNLKKIPINLKSVSDKMDSDGDGHHDKEEVTNGFDPFGPGRLGPYDYNLANRFKGTIFLVVDMNGKTWYIDMTGQRWSVTLNNSIDLFVNLALGITNENLAKIENKNLDISQ